MPIWKGSKNDNAMADLCPLLAMIVMKKIDCVEAVQKVRAQETKDISKGIKYKTLRGSIL